MSDVHKGHCLIHGSFTVAGPVNIDINNCPGCIEDLAQPRKSGIEGSPPPADPEEDFDVLVNLGDMANAKIDKIVLDAGYEKMVKDIIGNFNWIVSQGIAPMTALFAMTQALAIVMGCCLRANMPPAVGAKLIGSIIKNADASAKMVQIVTKN